MAVAAAALSPEAVSAGESEVGLVGNHQLPCNAESCAIILVSSLSILLSRIQAGPDRKVKLLHPLDNTISQLVFTVQ